MGILDTGISVPAAFATEANSAIPQKVGKSSLLMIFIFGSHYAYKIKNVFEDINKLSSFYNANFIKSHSVLQSNNNGAKRFLHELPQTAAYKKKQSRACNIHMIHSFERF